MLSLEQLQSTHPMWKEVAQSSNYHYQSFLGGNTYKMGQHLTRYLDENNGPGDQYLKRIMSTPLDNHVQTTVDIYRSFLFRELPNRTLGGLLNNPLVEQWITDTDQEGQDMNSFLKTANDLAMTMGSVWILVDKPTYKVETQAQEIEMNIRAYACTYSPQNVIDWFYQRNVAGKMMLEYVKLIESENTQHATVTCWHADHIEKYKVLKNEEGGWEEIAEYQEYANPLGYIPIVHHAPIRTPYRGVGQSLVADVADQQKMIYNLMSELEQSIRISGHPTLVKTPSTDASAGAGAIITVQDDMDPGLKPYLLVPSSNGVNGILETVENCVGAIQRMTHTSAVQATRGQAISGIALTTERQLLNAKLSDIADTLSETELKMWNIWFDWQAISKPEEFTITYPESFDIRDRGIELEYMLKARSSGVSNVLYQEELSKQIVKLTIEDDHAQNVILEDMNNTEFTPVPMVNPESGDSTVANTKADYDTLIELGYL